MPKLSVTITLGYVGRCEACVQYARQTVSAALYDGQVTSISLKAVDRCEHESARELEARARQPIAAPVAVPQRQPPEEVPVGVTPLIPGVAAGLPNGFEAEAS